MADAEPSGCEQPPPTLALVAMLARNVHRAAAERDGMSADLKKVVALSYLRQRGSVGQRSLGPVLCVDANNTVLLLNELETDGLVVRTRDPQDRRRHLVALTERGHATLRQAEAELLPVEDDMLAALDVDQREQLTTLLHRVIYGPGGVLTRRNDPDPAPASSAAATDD